MTAPSIGTAASPQPDAQSSAPPDAAAGVRPRPTRPWILDAGLWVWLALVIVWIHTIRFTGWFNWDSSLFLAMGKWLAMGLIPYRDALEVKPPGMFLYLAGLFSVVAPTAWAIRFGDVAWTLAGSWALVRLLLPQAGYLATAVAATAWIGWHHAALFDHGGVYTEHYGALAGLIALACRGAVASGFWVAAALLCKHPAAAVLVAVVIYRCRGWRLRDWAIFAVAMAAPIGAVLLWMAVTGAWQDFLEANLWILVRHGRFANLPYDYRLLLLWRSISGIVPLFPAMGAAAVLGVLAVLGTRTALAFAALAWWLVAMAGVMMQGRYFEHHYLLVLPPLALMGGLGLGWFIRLRPNEHRAVRGLRLAACTAVLWWGWGVVNASVVEDRAGFDRRWAQLWQGASAWPQGPESGFELAAGRYLYDRTHDGDRIHVQGYNPSLVHIYWYANRAPAAALFYEMPFVLDRPRQVAEAIAGDPAYVVIDRAAPLDPAMRAWLERDYMVEQTFVMPYVADLWRRRTDFGYGDRPELDQPPIVNPMHFEARAECVDPFQSTGAAN